ncbi:ABC transporter ATP-binding protein [Nocardioides sp. AE5]|uniref:ABC transporter ATP-binding protein n=1 Tax=Nocardioides sp. AE5 TaxID=2962573 RepID=UPI0028813B0F|nr:ABC transporter ATP-binding protein [Nocardioides sp. AE5]MDT0203858.1 ABC transporter ATP-binding protein [Nocardioides sp. AE5]
MLSIQNLEVVYDDVVLALRGVSLDIPDGKIVALLGANGAGKSTVLRSLSGLLDVHDGEIRKGAVTLDGTDVGRHKPSALAGLGIKHVLEGRRIFKEMTVEENLRIGAHANRKDIAGNLARVYELFPKLLERRAQTAGYLSGGEQQMLAIGRALMSAPRYLLLDEPSLGLAPLIVAQIRDIIVEINAQGTGILLVEQNASMALSIADHGYVMETGRVVMDRPAKELLADEDVREFYLGLGGEGRSSFRDVKHYKRRKRWAS